MSAYLAAARRAAPAGDPSRGRRLSWQRHQPWSASLLKGEPFFAECQVTSLEDLRDDVRVAAHLEIDDGRSAVLELVQGRQLLGFGLDVGELAVVPDGFDEEGLLVLRRPVSELQTSRVL